MCFQSHIFHDGGTKACIVSISWQLTQSQALAAKTCVSFSSFGSSYFCVIFYHLLIIINGNQKFHSSLITFYHLSVVCYDVLYRVLYRGTCTEICIGFYKKMYRCSPKENMVNIIPVIEDL